MTNAEDSIQLLSNDDVVVIPKGLDTIIMQCCDCGLWHEINIDHKENGDIHLQFTRIEGEPKVSNVITLDFDRRRRHDKRKT